MERQMRGPSMVVWLSAATVIVFLIWAFFAWVDEIVRAEGSMISSSRPQIIQNLEGGILAELAVGEGDIVEAGDVLARLHNTQFQSSVDDLQDQISAFEIRRLAVWRPKLTVIIHLTCRTNGSAARLIWWCPRQRCCRRVNLTM